MKKQTSLLLVILIFLGLLTSNAIAVQASSIGKTGVWAIRAEISFAIPFPIPFPIDMDSDFLMIAEIVGETTTKLIVELNAPDLPDYAQYGYVYKIQKNENQGGFYRLQTGGYWGLWINPSEISETTEFVFDDSLYGILGFSGDNPFELEGPFTFSVESGKIIASNQSYNTWAFIKNDIQLFYEKESGLLVKLIYSLDMTLIQINGYMDLRESTMLSTKAIPSFTIDILIASFSMLVLGGILRRKRKGYNNKKSIVHCWQTNWRNRR